jgi:hypothetical protein
MRKSERRLGAASELLGDTGDEDFVSDGQSGEGSFFENAQR